MRDPALEESLHPNSYFPLQAWGRKNQIMGHFWGHQHGAVEVGGNSVVACASGGKMAMVVEVGKEPSALLRPLILVGFNNEKV